MSKTRKFRKLSKKQKNKKKKSKTLYRKKYIGGVGSSIGFPPCTDVTIFKILDSQIAEFRRDLNVGMDCFINALQIFGVLDSKCANIIRMSSAATSTGFSIKQMESIFIYLVGNNFCFRPYDSFEVFRGTIQRTIQPGSAVFVGYETMGPNLRIFRHVFIIARTIDGSFVIIDPQQIPQKIAPLNDEEASKYLLFPGNRTIYYILHNSKTKLDINQLEYVRDISSGVAPELARFKYFSTLPLDQREQYLRAQAQRAQALTALVAPMASAAPMTPVPMAQAPMASAPMASAPMVLESEKITQLK
jgi:hypothetical protein